jgi:hypothetical protein
MATAEIAQVMSSHQKQEKHRETLDWTVKTHQGKHCHVICGAFVPLSTDVDGWM